MFNIDKQEKIGSKEAPILHKPNKFIKLIENLHWIYSAGFLLVITMLYIVLITPSEREFNDIEAFLSLVYLTALIFLPFHLGVRIGSNIYKPREQYLSQKQLKEMNNLIKEGKSFTINVEDDFPEVNKK